MRVNQSGRNVAKPRKPKDYQRTRPPYAPNWLSTDPCYEKLEPGTAALDESADSRSPQEHWSEFPCLLAHDLNNYIGIVLGRAQLLSEKCASDEKMAEDCEHIISVTYRIAALIKHSSCQGQAKPRIQKTR